MLAADKIVHIVIAEDLIVPFYLNL